MTSLSNLILVGAVAAASSFSVSAQPEESEFPDICLQIPNCIITNIVICKERPELIIRLLEAFSESWARGVALWNEIGHETTEDGELICDLAMPYSNPSHASFYGIRRESSTAYSVHTHPHVLAYQGDAYLFSGMEQQEEVGDPTADRYYFFRFPHYFPDTEA